MFLGERGRGRAKDKEKENRWRRRGPVPIIHDTVEHGSETRACFVCTVRGKRVRRFRLFTLPPSADKIRFRYPVLGLPSWKKKKEKRRGIGPRLINSERKSCSLGDTLRSRDFLDSFHAGFLPLWFSFNGP